MADFYLDIFFLLVCDYCHIPTEQINFAPYICFITYKKWSKEEEWELDKNDENDAFEEVKYKRNARKISCWK